jgi:hypothetical protein
VSATFGPGDRIRCIRADSFPGLPQLAVAPPNIYTVARMRHEPPKQSLTGQPGMWFCQVCGEAGDAAIPFDLMEMPPHPRWAWCHCCFAPTWDEPGDEAQIIARARRAAQWKRLRKLEPSR